MSFQKPVQGREEFHFFRAGACLSDLELQSTSCGIASIFKTPKLYSPSTPSLHPLHLSPVHTAATRDTCSCLLSCAPAEWIGKTSSLSRDIFTNNLISFLSHNFHIWYQLSGMAEDAAIVLAWPRMPALHREVLGLWSCSSILLSWFQLFHWESRRKQVVIKPMIKIG